jgi:PhnB protein
MVGLVQEYQGVTPHLIVHDAASAIAFYQEAFGAELLERSDGPDGRVWHCELRIAGGRVVLADEFPELGMVSPRTIGEAPIALHMYVHDVDESVSRAVAAGAEVAPPQEAMGLEQPFGVSDMYWGDRYGMVLDPFGYRWEIATRRAVYSPEELDQRRQDFYARADISPETTRQRAEQWHAEHPQFNRPSLPPSAEA